jgi:GntR family transcriptional repressor for pyruvate dehydrogenase complex
MANPRRIHKIPEARTTGSDRVVKILIDRIHKGELKVGQRLPSEEKLCEEFGSSRTVVREALQQLKAMGVVRSRSGSGTYVTEGQLEQLGDSLQLYSARADDYDVWSELLELRLLIETESVRRLATLGNPAALSPVWEALETMRQSTQDLEAFARADVAFHEAIVKASGNDLFVTVHRAVIPIALRFAQATYYSIGQVQENLDGHQRIFDALMHRNEEEASREMRDHLQLSAKNIEKIFKLRESEG